MTAHANFSHHIFDNSWLVLFASIQSFPGFRWPFLCLLRLTMLDFVAAFLKYWDEGCDVIGWFFLFVFFYLKMNL